MMYTQIRRNKSSSPMCSWHPCLHVLPRVNASRVQKTYEWITFLTNPKHKCQPLRDRSKILWWEAVWKLFQTGHQNFETFLQMIEDEFIYKRAYLHLMIYVEKYFSWIFNLESSFFFKSPCMSLSNQFKGRGFTLWQALIVQIYNTSPNWNTPIDYFKHVFNSIRLDTLYSK